VIVERLHERLDDGASALVFTTLTIARGLLTWRRRSLERRTLEVFDHRDSLELDRILAALEALP
jgi:hypothetical protein